MRFAGIDIAAETHFVAVVDQGGNVVFANPSAVMRRVFDITGMSSIITVVAD